MDDNRKAANYGGSLKISKDVIESITRYTVAEMDGVASLAPKAMISTGWFLEKRTVKPVSIEISDGVATIDIRLCTESGANIPELSKKVQSAVKDAVQNMTGIVVDRVNLHIAGISFADRQAV